MIAKLLRAGDEAALLDYARWESSIRVKPTATSLAWTDTAVRLLIRCRIEVGGGTGEPAARPLLLRNETAEPDSASYVEIPPHLLPPGFDRQLLRVNSRVRRAFVTFRLRGAIDRARHAVPCRVVQTPVEGAPGCWTPEIEVEVSVDPGARSTDSQFAPGLLDVTAEIRFVGWALSQRVRVDAGTALPGAALDRPRHWLWPFRTTHGYLSLALQGRPPRSGGLRGSVALTGGTRHHPERIELSLTDVGRLPDDVTVALVNGSRRVELPVTSVLSGSAGPAKVTASCTDAAVTTGRWKVLLGIGDGSPELALSSRLGPRSAAWRLVAALTARGRRLVRR